MSLGALQGAFGDRLAFRDAEFGMQPALMRRPDVNAAALGSLRSRFGVRGARRQSRPVTRLSEPDPPSSLAGERPRS